MPKHFALISTSTRNSFVCSCHELQTRLSSSFYTSPSLFLSPFFVSSIPTSFSLTPSSSPFLSLSHTITRQTLATHRIPPPMECPLLKPCFSIIFHFYLSISHPSFSLFTFSFIFQWLARFSSLAPVLLEENFHFVH